MEQSVIEQTLNRLDEISTLAKIGITTSSGLVFYDLENEAKLLYPVLAPIRKRMPRIGKTNAGSGLSAHWNVITNPNSLGVVSSVEEGKRGGQITPLTAAKVAVYKGLGLEGVVAWEAEYAGEGYDDIRAIAQRTVLDSMFLAEEPMLLWGNSGTSGVGIQFGVTPTPTGTPSTSGGSLAATTYYIYCVALSHQGWAYNVNSSPLTITQQITRNNADGTTTVINGGTAQSSVVSAGIVVGGSGAGSIAAAVTAVKGAAGYAWFLGTATGTCYINQITTNNVAVITTATGSGQLQSSLTAADYSYNPLAFDGLITQALANNGYFASLNGASITHDGANGIVEFDVALKYFWDTYRTSPTRIYYGSQVARDATRAMLNSGSNSSFGVRLQTNDTGHIVGSAMVNSYLNKFAWGGAVPIPMEIHPNMPDGYVFFDCEVNPYPTSNIPNARCVRTRRDYFQVLWPITTRNWQNGIYTDQMLQVYVPYTMGLIANIGAGYQ